MKNMHINIAVILIIPSLYCQCSFSAQVVSWGNIKTPNEDVNNIRVIASGWHHSFAINQDGRIIAWGYNYDNQAMPPDGNDFTALSGGRAIVWHYGKMEALLGGAGTKMVRQVHRKEMTLLP